MTDDTTQWLDELRTFVGARRADLDIPNGHHLGELDNWKRRVTGGVLLQFLDFLQSGQVDQHYAGVLEKFPLDRRALLCITDLAGLVAGHELIQADSDHALCILKQEWRTWLSRRDVDHDEPFLDHYEFWSVWHQDLHSQWELDELDDAAYWVHEEGFALAPKAGRGAQHLWKWDGQDMTKLEEAISSWSSIPTDADPTGADPTGADPTGADPTGAHPTGPTDE